MPTNRAAFRALQPVETKAQNNRRLSSSNLRGLPIRATPFAPAPKY
ncbi:MAG TPA: hypothetical protein VG713_19370 [Pirellulales bacterium]|nr:hypothetical protein [Pirellulales bacterium]